VDVPTTCLRPVVHCHQPLPKNQKHLKPKPLTSEGEAPIDGGPSRAIILWVPCLGDEVACDLENEIVVVVLDPANRQVSLNRAIQV
jgi:hypothetical protein